jgi:hypothetical protein
LEAVVLDKMKYDDQVPHQGSGSEDGEEVNIKEQLEHLKNRAKWIWKG